MFTAAPKSILSLVIGLLAFVPGYAQGVNSAGEPIPDTIYSRGSLLQFYAIDRAVDSAGRIDTNLLRENTAKSLQDTLDHPASASGCVELSGGSTLDFPFPGFENLETSITNSDNVLIGQVVGLRSGGMGHILGTLVWIETEKIIVGNPNHRFFIFFPKGEFTARGQSYCIANDIFPPLPKPGDRMLILHQDQNTGSEILGIGPRQLAVLPKSGAAPQLGSDALDGTSLDFKTNAAVIQWVKQSLEGTRQESKRVLGKVGATVHSS